MVKAGRCSLSSQLVEAWQTRLRSIRGSLADDPANLDAWLWRIQERILSFLVARYADDEDLAANPPRPPAPLERVRPGLGPEYGSPPKPHELIRRLLERIADANRKPWR